MYLIAGDSWGCGEWSANNHEVCHRGLWKYMEEANMRVINLSQGGTSNWENYKALKHWFDAGTNKHLKSPLGSSPNDKILFFQTQWTRDLHNPQTHDLLTINTQDIEGAFICRLYYNLSRLSKETNVPIAIIGGCSDTIWIDKFSVEYPGLEIACQSMTNLCINQDHRIDHPIFAGIQPRLADMMFHKSKFRDLVLYLIDQEQIRLAQWQDHPQWFFPDGVHANRHGHKLLFEHLLSNGTIKMSS